MKVTDDLFLRYIKEDVTNGKPKTAFKFSMIGLSHESSNLIEKALHKENNELLLGGFRHTNYVQMPVNLLVIESAELLMFIFEIAHSELFNEVVQYYIRFTEIYLLVVDDTDLDKSIEFLKRFKERDQFHNTKKSGTFTILLGLNFNYYDNYKKQVIINLQSELEVSHWFLMNSSGDKKDSSILNITDLSEFFLLACNSYLELCN